MSDDATGNERRDALLREDRELKRRREEIRAELEAMGPDAIDAWYQQEYEREYAVNARKAERRRQLRAADEERKRKVDERRARMTPEAREKLKAGIAGLKEYTKEELKEEARLAQIKKKQDRALLRRWRNGNGSGDEPDAQ
jgi:bifunctional ADP-heptose synthase (sugar kinase/adenylyltransferase)